MNARNWDRVKELFERALENSPPTTDNLNLHGEEEEVRLEVERLVREYLEAGSFLNPATRDIPEPAFAPGQLIGERYFITERLGQGGMGEVYQADDRQLGAAVAIKTILPDVLANPNALSRFRREILVARKVTHPNVCRVFDLNVHEQPSTGKSVLFLTMELLCGDTLSERLKKRGRFTAEQAYPLIRQMAEGIHAAHSAGVIHRDLKSANVMLIPNSDGTERVVITDFGLAREMLREETLTMLTAPRQVPGTPAYMAPELFMGADTTVASDLYAFGVIQFEMATGKRPGAPGESPRKLVPDIDPVWEAEILRCLHRDPAQRFSSALVAVSALETAVQAPVRKPARRRTAPLALGAVLILLALLIVNWDRIHAFLTGVPEAKHIAVLPFVAIGATADRQAFADGLTETVTSKLSALEQFQKALWVVPASEVRSRKLTSVEETRKAFGVTLVITGNVQLHGDAITVTANLIDARNVKQLQSRTIEMSTKSAASLQTGVVNDIAGMLGIRVGSQARQTLSAGGTDNPEAYRLYEEGLGYLRRFGQDNVDRAIQLFQEALAKDAKFALGFTRLGEAYLLHYAFTKNAVDLDLAKFNVDRALQLDKNLGAAHATLANILSGTSHLPEAVKEFHRALELEPTDNMALVGLAKAYSNSGNFKEAEATFQKAIEIRPDYWLGYSAKGAFYYEQSQYSSAEKMFKAVVELTPESGLGYFNLGAVYLATARYSDAEHVLRRSVALKPNAMAYSNLSICYSYQNQPRKAVEMLEKAVALDPNNDVNWRNLGDAYLLVPDLAHRAPDAYAKALEAVRKRLMVKPSSADLLISSALYYAKLKDLARALAALEMAPTSGQLNSAQLFKTALVWELIGKRHQALMSLSEAIRRGYSREQILREPELAALRKDPKFTVLFGSDPHARN